MGRKILLFLSPGNYMTCLGPHSKVEGWEWVVSAWHFAFCFIEVDGCGWFLGLILYCEFKTYQQEFKGQKIEKKNKQKNNLATTVLRDIYPRNTRVGGSVASYTVQKLAMCLFETATLL